MDDQAFASNVEFYLKSFNWIYWFLNNVLNDERYNLCDPIQLQNPFFYIIIKSSFSMLGLTYGAIAQAFHKKFKKALPTYA